MNLLQQFEAEQVARLSAARAVPEFQAGDTLRVMVRVVEGERTRLQAYEGVCVARSNRGLNSNFTVRKLSYGEGVERVFPLYSPNIDSIKVVRRGRVRRAKLYYLRDRRGKSARIVERVDKNAASRRNTCRSAQYRTRVPVTPRLTRPASRSTEESTKGVKGTSGPGAAPRPDGSAKVPGSPRRKLMA